MLWVAIAAFAIAAAAGAAAGVAVARRRARAIVAQARTEAASVVRSAQLDAGARRRAAQTQARERALAERAAAEEELTRAVEQLARREERVAEEEAAFSEDKRALDDKWDAFKRRKRAIRSARDRAASLRRAADAALAQMRDQLAARAGATPEQVRDRIAAAWIEEARAAAANRVRSLDGTAADPEMDRAARRLLEIASARYRNHFLTERLISRVPLQPGVRDLLEADGGRLLAAIAEGANVQLVLDDGGADLLRLEGLDGVGREVARRALSRLAKDKHRAAARADAAAWVTGIKDQLHREIRHLGKKAFRVLKVPPAHPEIVELVGRLNYRTSYTQNQWLHAVEASFLCGLMAEELGLDVQLARRACLLHDIGKSLTHEMDGSHAVIGADIARRLGEDEIVANAIGAHHADEPPNSVYAYLVAAGDAMSGARPGARRMMTQEYGSRIEDLERIGNSYPGVERAYAVHGGRELRVYIKEGALSDAEVVELSADIAARISDEMTFPGQIKVTVIRAYEAVAVAS
ncbi:MAG: DUF3552 domain-containing protein [Deltaproteobacteria bacterium]|nr:MAG: DUF3552 domain-containing protein [Deltaproteobacteria bacterium]